VHHLRLAKQLARAHGSAWWRTETAPVCWPAALLLASAAIMGYVLR
jgi:hypothetical protein